MIPRGRFLSLTVASVVTVSLFATGGSPATASSPPNDPASPRSGDPSADARSYPPCSEKASPKGFARAEDAPSNFDIERICVAPDFYDSDQNSPNAPVAHNGTHSPTTNASPYTGLSGTILTTNPDVTHPAPSGTYEFVSSQVFAYGSQTGGWLELGWVESDGFTPSTGAAQRMFTYDPNDPNGNKWQLHYTVSPGANYSYRVNRCNSGGVAYYCGYTYLSDNTWALLRTSGAASGCTPTNGCQMTHILVEVQSTDTTPHPTLGGSISFSGMILRRAGTDYLWTTSIAGTTETTDSVYAPSWGTKWHAGSISKTGV